VDKVNLGIVCEKDPDIINKFRKDILIDVSVLYQGANLKSN
jgi:hypothetical protein